MTTQELYQKVKKNEISKNDFLWEVRRDSRFSYVLNSTMTYEDTVSVLKSKGFISDVEEMNAFRAFDFQKAFKSLNEGKDNRLKGGKGDKLTPDDVNYYEFQKGWRHELEHTYDIDKAKEIALDHLAEDPNYYTRLEMIEYAAKKKNRTDLPIDISKKNASKKDDANQMKPVPKKKVIKEADETPAPKKPATKKAAPKKSAAKKEDQFEYNPDVKYVLTKNEKGRISSDPARTYTKEQVDRILANIEKYKGRDLLSFSGFINLDTEEEHKKAREKKAKDTVPYVWKTKDYVPNDSKGEPDLSRKKEGKLNFGDLSPQEVEAYKKDPSIEYVMTYGEYEKKVKKTKEDELAYYRAQLAKEREKKDAEKRDAEFEKTRLGGSDYQKKMADFKAKTPAPKGNVLSVTLKKPGQAPMDVFLTPTEIEDRRKKGFDVEIRKNDINPKTLTPAPPPDTTKRNLTSTGVREKPQPEPSPDLGKGGKYYLLDRGAGKIHPEKFDNAADARDFARKNGLKNYQPVPATLATKYIKESIESVEEAAADAVSFTYKKDQEPVEKSGQIKKEIPTKAGVAFLLKDGTSVIFTKKSSGWRGKYVESTRDSQGKVGQYDIDNVSPETEEFLKKKYSIEEAEDSLSGKSITFQVKSDSGADNMANVTGNVTKVDKSGEEVVIHLDGGGKVTYSKKKPMEDVPAVGQVMNTPIEVEKEVGAGMYGIYTPANTKEESVLEKYIRERIKKAIAEASIIKEEDAKPTSSTIALLQGLVDKFNDAKDKAGKEAVVKEIERMRGKKTGPEKSKMEDFKDHALYKLYIEMIDRINLDK